MRPIRVSTNNPATLTDRCLVSSVMMQLLTVQCCMIMLLSMCYSCNTSVDLQCYNVVIMFIMLQVVWINNNSGCTVIQSVYTS